MRPTLTLCSIRNTWLRVRAGRRRAGAIVVELCLAMGIVDFFPATSPSSEVRSGREAPRAPAKDRAPREPPAIGSLPARDSKEDRDIVYRYMDVFRGLGFMGSWSWAVQRSTIHAGYARGQCSGPRVYEMWQFGRCATSF